MKLTYKQKVKTYEELKYKQKSFKRLPRDYKIDITCISYLYNLADRWSMAKLQHTCTYYSPEFKKAAIGRVLKGHETQ